jgi:predicted  nucleic acid-binding Zn-ribbon protein
LLNEKKDDLRGADYKTLQAKKSEIERMQNLETEQERIIIELVNRIDNVSTGFEKHGIEVQKEIDKLEQIMKDEQDQLVSYQNDLELKQLKRSEYLRGIPQEWLDNYHEMKEKVPDPVVALSNESCSGCFSMFTPADLQAIRRNSLVTCKLCYRLVYLP